MSAQEIRRIATDLILSISAGSTGVASTMDDIEQGGRIFLQLLTAVSLVLLIAVNWEKGKAQIKKWFK